MHPSTLLPTAYLAPIYYYSKIKNYQHFSIEHFENYPKQTYRARCHIYSPNGLKKLSIPLVKRNHRQLIKDLKISYDEDWQKVHWRTLITSYRSSPFFEYYEDDFAPFYRHNKQTYLIDFNDELQQKIMSLLPLNTRYSVTSEYKMVYPMVDDFRSFISPKVPIESDLSFEVKPYIQVFQEKHGFIPNLSILDLLFNQGPNAINYL